MAVSDGLMVSCNLDEANGSAVDLASGVSLAEAGGALGANALFLGSRNFNPATSQRLQVADPAAVNLSGVMMGEIWVWLSAKGSGRDIISKFLTTGNQRSFIVTYSSTSDRFALVVSANGTATTTVTANNFGSPSINTPYQIIWWVSATEAGIRVNKGTPDVAAHTGGVFDSTADFVIGGRSGSSTLTWTGLLSKARIWNRILTEQEQTNLWNTGIPAPHKSLDSLTGSVRRRAIFGQSNASGRGTNNRAYASPIFDAAQWNGSGWIKLADPFDANAKVLDAVANDSTAPGGHWIHAYATDAMQDLPLGALVVAKGGTSITGFLPGVDHQDRSTLYGSLVYQIVRAGGVQEVFWWQGETDAVDGMSQATYNAHLDTIANALMADLPAGYEGIRVCKLGHLLAATATQAEQDAINAAIEEAWGDNPNVLQGPDFTGIDSDDDFHFTTNAKVDQAGGMWWDSESPSIQPGGSNVSRRFLMGVG